MAKNTSTTEAKAKRPARTIEERIAELQAQAEARKAKDVAKDRKVFDVTAEKFERARRQMDKFAGQLVVLHEKHGFELPPELTVADDATTGSPVVTSFVDGVDSTED